MPAPSQPITQSDFTALAALANSKINLAGRPYNFDAPRNPFDSSPPTIWTELAWLRANLFSQFVLFNKYNTPGSTFGYSTRWPFHPSILVSETFTYLNSSVSNLMQLQTFDLDVQGGASSGQVQTPSVDRVFGQVPTWKNPKYVYSRTTGQIKSRVVLSEFVPLGILRTELPITGQTPSPVPTFDYANFCLFSASQKFTCPGVVGQLHTVKLSVSGIFETKKYENGSNNGAYLQIGGNPLNAGSNPGYNEYKLTISDPPQVLYFNREHPGVSSINIVNYEATVSIRSGSTVELQALSINGNENVNRLNKVNTKTAGILPNQGQYIQVGFFATDSLYTEYFHDFPPERFYKYNDAALNPSVPFKFKLRFDGANFVTTFQVNWLARSRTTSSTDTLALFGSNAADCTLVKVYDGIVDGVAQWHGSIFCTANYSADMTFEVGIRDSTEGTTQALDYIEKAAITETQSTLKKQICFFERLDSNAAPWPVLDAFTDGSIITPPNFAALQALPWQESNGEWISPATHEYPNALFTGNQAKIYMLPTNAADDFKSSGCWIVQSSPIGTKYFYEAYGFTGSNPRGLNRGAIDTSAGYAAGQPGFPKSSPHSNDLVPPTYPARQVPFPISTYSGVLYTPFDIFNFEGSGAGSHIWEFIHPVTGQPISGGYFLQGGVITSITIKRKPVKNAKGIWVDAPATSAINVEIGRSFANDQNYRALFSTTIPAGQQSITLSTFILVQTVYPERSQKLQLLGIANEPIEIVSKFQAPMRNFYGHALTPSISFEVIYFNNLINANTENTQPSVFFEGFNQTGFHLASSFNDVEAMLNLIS